MAGMYETQRVHFDKILEKYNAYLALFAECNGGETTGATPFREFYWRYTYHYKYADPSNMREDGY